MKTVKFQSNIVTGACNLLLIALVATFLFVSHARAQSGNVYANNQVQSVGLSEEGVVLQVSIKQTQASWQARTGGAASGGFLGAMIGDSLGGDYQTKNILRAVGAIAGGIAGERVADQAASSDAQEIVVGIFNTATGSISRVITVIQPAPFESLSQRDKVLVVNTNGTVRVIRVGYDILTYQR